jgi:hypothetical protein
MLLKKNLGQFSKNYRTFYSKNVVTMLSKIWVWDLESVIRDPRYGIRKKPITDPGYLDPDQQHWY